MSNANLAIENGGPRNTAIKVSRETYERITAFAESLSDGLRKVTRADALDHLVENALKAERGEAYAPYSTTKAGETP